LILTPTVALMAPTVALMATSTTLYKYNQFALGRLSLSY